MRIVPRLALAGALLALTAAPARAQTSLSQTVSLGYSAADPYASVFYLPIVVTTGGTFSFGTYGLADPSLLLFSQVGGALGTLLYGDPNNGAQYGYDDAYGAGGSANDLDAFFEMHLDAGVYTLATSLFFFGPDEALTGINEDVGSYDCAAGDCTYSLSVASVDGVATVTPEPVSMVLLGSGLAGLGMARRRRRRTTALEL